MLQAAESAIYVMELRLWDECLLGSDKLKVFDTFANPSILKGYLSKSWKNRIYVWHESDWMLGYLYKTCYQ